MTNTAETKNSYFDKKGFECVPTNTVSYEECFRSNGVYVTLSPIGYSHREDKLIYFVSGSNGDEFGQFATKEAAIEKAKKMAALTEDERKVFDS